MDFNEKTINRQEIFKGNIIDVALDEVELPNGKTAQRELVFHNGGVGLLALTAEQKIVLVKQFRKPLERTILEIPAGKIEQGETDPKAVAVRELEEETDYIAGSISPIADFILSPGFCDERHYLFLATDLRKSADPLPPDEDEFLEIIELTLAEAKQEIVRGTICDAKTMYAILYWESFMS